MTTLLTMRDSIKDFISKNDRFTTPVFKFIGAFLALWSFTYLFGYSNIMNQVFVMLVLALICAFVSIPTNVFILGVVGLIHMTSISLDVAGVYLGLFAIIYYLYIRFCPKTGLIIMFTPLFYIFKLHYIVPILVGMFLGPVGMIPVGAGVVLYYFSKYVNQLSQLMATTTKEDSIQGFTFVLNGLVKDKAMLLTVVVFMAVVLITYVIYKLSVSYSWYIAIGIGAVLEIVLFLIGGFAMEAETNILVIVIGTLVGALICYIVQFFKGSVDYARTEHVQFEDDDYYYYVKAVPKVSVPSQNVNVQRINKRIK